VAFRISAPGAGYALAMGILLVVGGRLGDRYGQRRMFLIGIAGLTVASLWCGLSAGPAMLIAGRLVRVSRVQRQQRDRYQRYQAKTARPIPLVVIAPDA
jgi:MFS family permease